MRAISAITVAMITVAGVGRSAAEPAGAVSITFPDPGDDMAISDGLQFQVKAAKGATDLECRITQGSVTWKDTETASSTACAPDHKATTKFKPGPAKLSVRAKVGGGWGKPTTLAVKLVGDAPAAVAECHGPKCAANRKPAQAEADVAVPSTVKVGDRRPASWDGTYTATLEESQSGFTRCPTSHNEEDFAHLEVEGGEVHFALQLDLPGSPLLKMTAKIGSDGKITGTSTLSPDTLAALAKRHPNNAHYKLERHKTLKIEGKVYNVNQLRKRVGIVEQGRVLKIIIDNKSFLTLASGSDLADGCAFEAKAEDYVARDAE